MARVRTRNNFDFWECSSAYQKCVRRGLEEDALHFAYELYISNYGEYFWKRSVIIAMEDIGIADPHAITHILSLKDAYEYLHKKEDPHERLCIIQAVIYLCRAKKSRLVDWTKMKLVNTHHSRCGVNKVDELPVHPLEIPEFALDCHTRRGKQAGKTVQDFISDGSKLANHLELPGEAELRGFAEYFHQLPEETQKAARPPLGGKNPLMPEKKTRTKTKQVTFF